MQITFKATKGNFIFYLQSSAGMSPKTRFILGTLNITPNRKTHI